MHQLEETLISKLIIYKTHLPFDNIIFAPLILLYYFFTKQLKEINNIKIFNSDHKNVPLSAMRHWQIFVVKSKHPHYFISRLLTELLKEDLSNIYQKNKTIFYYRNSLQQM